MSNKRDRATARAGRLSAANSAKRRLNPPCFFIDRNDVLWRRALLGGVAAAALLAGATEQAKASVPSSPKCGSNWTWDPITATLTCTHDQSGGINNPGGVTTIKNLVVKDLTKNIAPPSGTPGISLGNSGDATLYSSTGSFYISTAGDNASGISVGAFGDATIISAGQISTTGAHAHGITASSDAGSSSITSTGNISTQGDDSAGIYSTSHGNNTVTSTGGVTTLGDNSQGIYANASGGCSKCELTKGEDMLSELFAFDSKLTITSTGNIITAGNYSNAIEAHSSSSILITSTGNLTTSGDRASGIFARASGGGCCTLAKAESIGPSGSNIIIVSTGNISTAGKNATGIYALSDSGIVSVTSTGNISTAGFRGYGISAFSEFGKVSVTSTGNISTAGRSAAGIYARSSTGDVTVTSNGRIMTTGDFSDGVKASASDDDGNGKATVTSTGEISVKGRAATGISAYSDNGPTIINSTGNVSASGAGGIGVKATTFGGTNTVNINAGTVTGGAAADGKSEKTLAAAIAFRGYGTNTLNNAGTIGKLGDLTVYSQNGATAVNNSGIIYGDVNLGSSGEFKKIVAPATPNTFNNLEGSTFNSGSTVKLGADGTLSNDGTLNTGGAGARTTTSLTGKLIQGLKGIFAVDVDHGAGTNDKLDVSGTATLAGKVLPTLTNIDFNHLNKTFTILSAAGGTTVNGLSVTDTATIDYSLLYPNSKDVVLALSVNFNAAGLNENQARLAGYLNGALGNAPSGLIDALTVLAAAPDAATLGRYLDQLFSTASSSSVSSSLLSGQAFALALRSCPVADGSYSQLAETSCLWAKPAIRRFRQDKTADMAEIRDQTSGLSGGFQTQLGENIWGGLGLSIEGSGTTVNNTARFEGTWWQAGGAAKWVNGPMKISGTVSGGEGDIDQVRSLGLPGIAAAASSSNRIDFATGITRFQYTFGETGFYATPMFDIGANYLHLGGFTETGAGALGLNVDSTSKWIFAATPAVEIGTSMHVEGMTLRPYLKAGVTFLSEDSIATTARFVGGPAGSSFNIVSKFDDVFADLNAGVQLFSTAGLNLRFNYEGKFGENSRENAFDAKVTVNY